MSTAVKSRTEPMLNGISLGAGRLHRLSVEQYERMTELGIEDRVELLDGWIVDKMPQDPPRALAIDLTHERLAALLPADWRVREQKPIRLAESEPEPDIAVILAPVSRYARRHPVAADVAMAVEVADS